MTSTRARGSHPAGPDPTQQLRATMAELRTQLPVNEQISGEALRHRQQIFIRLRRTVMARQAARQRYVWPTLRSRLPDGPEQVSHLVDQKRRIEELLLEVRWFGDRDNAVNGITAELLSCLDEHLGTEAELIDHLRTIVGPEQVRVLTERADRAQLLAPRRPHPYQPAVHPLVSVLFRPVAVMDRILDAIEFGPSGS